MCRQSCRPDPPLLAGRHPAAAEASQSLDTGRRAASDSKTVTERSRLQLIACCFGWIWHALGLWLHRDPGRPPTCCSCLPKDCRNCCCSGEGGVSWDGGVSWTGVSGACPAAVPLLRPLIGEAPCTWDWSWSALLLVKSLQAAGLKPASNILACTRTMGSRDRSQECPHPCRAISWPPGCSPEFDGSNCEAHIRQVRSYLRAAACVRWSGGPPSAGWLPSASAPGEQLHKGAPAHSSRHAGTLTAPLPLGQAACQGSNSAACMQLR